MTVQHSTYTVIRLSEVEPGVCGLTPADKQEVADLFALPGADVEWNVCSICPYGATVVLDQWTGTLADVLERTRPQIDATNTFSLPVTACGTDSVKGAVRRDADPITHDFKITVKTGTAIRHYDPQLQIRDQGRAYLPWWVLLGALFGMAGGVMLGRYLWRSRR